MCRREESSCQGSRFVIAHNKPESEDMPLATRFSSLMSGVCWCQPTEVVKLRSELDRKGEHAASPQAGPFTMAVGARTTWVKAAQEQGPKITGLWLSKICDGNPGAKSKFKHA